MAKKKSTTASEPEVNTKPSPETSGTTSTPEVDPKTTGKATGKATEATSTPDLVTPTHKVNFRKGPHKDYEVLDKLEPGTFLSLLHLPGGAEVPGWALVRVEGTDAVGWVSSDYIVNVV